LHTANYPVITGSTEWTESNSECYHAEERHLSLDSCLENKEDVKSCQLNSSKLSVSAIKTGSSVKNYKAVKNPPKW